MSNDLEHWLKLSLARLPTQALAALLDEYGDPATVAALKPAALQRSGLTDRAVASLRDPDTDAIAAALDWASADDNHLLPVDSDDYPALLRQTRDWPALLYVKGDVGALHLPALAVVGSRNPTRGGIDNAGQFARHLGARGFTIVSGLAQGIDSAAHRGALAGNGRTVAVLGHGIDRVYPAANRELAHEIAASGAIVSEYPLGTAPRREHFPARNRIISGLCLGTLVIEAAYRSGSLITARLASEQGREVFAIPGSIHNPLAKGCHRLIRDGAKLVESAADIVDELEPLIGHLMQHKEADDGAGPVPAKRDPDYDKLLATIGFDPISADEVSGKCGLTIDQVSSMLLILELEGEVEVLQGGKYSRLRRTDTDH